MTFDEAKNRLIDLAREHGGMLTAELVERDDDLNANQDIVAAAAHAIAASTNIFATGRDGGWFPYSEIRFSDLR